MIIRICDNKQNLAVNSTFNILIYKIDVVDKYTNLEK